MFTPTPRSLIALSALAGSLGCAHAEGLYIGGSLSTPAYSSPVNGIGGGGDGSGTGVKLTGGYQLSPNFALETSLFTLGRTSDSNGSAKARGVSLDGVGSYELAPRWSVLGSLGVAQARFTTSLGDDSSPALKVGLGAQYEFNKQLALRVQYDRYHFSNAFDAKPYVGSYSVGLKYGF